MRRASLVVIQRRSSSEEVRAAPRLLRGDSGVRSSPGRANRVVAGAAAVLFGLAYGLCLVSGLRQAEHMANPDALWTAGYAASLRRSFPGPEGDICQVVARRAQDCVTMR
jgi:hypothetical protein